jgi:glycosyltransferase involved in cell wall biosynthesis
VEELRLHLQQLIDNVTLRAELRQKGRQRVKEHYTQAAIAANTVKVYRQILGETVSEMTTLREKEPAAVS